MKLFILLILMSNLAFAQVLPDYVKESRWAEQVEDGLMDGDIVWLQADNHEFLSIYTSSENTSKKTAVIVHGLGVHPDFSQVVQPLRVGLTEYGFNTLSIQMPVLENGIGSDSYMPLLNVSDKRISAAINFLKSEKLEADVLIAHSLGAVMSSHFLANNTHPFNRFIAIGMPKTAAKYLSKVNIPVLDLYGNDDIDSVMQGIKDKADASKHNSNYLQKMVTTDHFFNDNDELLINEVSTWLK